MFWLFVGFSEVRLNPRAVESEVTLLQSYSGGEDDDVLEYIDYAGGE